jgi:hypothetical protein
MINSSTLRTRKIWQEAECVMEVGITLRFQITATREMMREWFWQHLAGLPARRSSNHAGVLESANCHEDTVFTNMQRWTEREKEDQEAHLIGARDPPSMPRFPRLNADTQSMNSDSPRCSSTQRQDLA